MTGPFHPHRAMILPVLMLVCAAGLAEADPSGGDPASDGAEVAGPAPVDADDAREVTDGATEGSERAVPPRRSRRRRNAEALLDARRGRFDRHNWPVQRSWRPLVLPPAMVEATIGLSIGGEEGAEPVTAGLALAVGASDRVTIGLRGLRGEDGIAVVRGLCVSGDPACDDVLTRLAADATIRLRPPGQTLGVAALVGAEMLDVGDAVGAVRAGARGRWNRGAVALRALVLARLVVSGRDVADDEVVVIGEGMYQLTPRVAAWVRGGIEGPPATASALQAPIGLGLAGSLSRHWEIGGEAFFVDVTDDEAATRRTLARLFVTGRM